MPVKINSVDVSKIAVSKVEDNLLIKSQKQALLTYDNDSFVIQTPQFIVESYGIPQHSTYYTTAKSRAFFKMPFCHDRRKYEDGIDYNAVKEMFEKFQELDVLFSSPEIKGKLFGDKADKYEYQALIRYPDETDGNLNKYYRPPYTKIKLDLDYRTEKPKYRVYNNVNGKRTEIHLNDFNDTLNHLKYLTKARFIIYLHKIYVNKNSLGNDKKKYGVILRARCIECTNKERPPKNSINESIFVDDSDQGEEGEEEEDAFHD